MDGLLISMDAFLSNATFDEWQLMKDGDKYCEKMWIDGNEVPLEKTRYSTGVSRADSYDKGDNYYHVEYQLKSGIDYIPEKAFKGLVIKTINLPEGIRTLKQKCFHYCKFEGDLKLPDSIERICKNAFEKATVAGTFGWPKGVRYIDSLPESEREKDEYNLPEGLIRFCPEYIKTNNLYIPASLKDCRTQYSSSTDNIIGGITINPANTVFAIKDDILINLTEEKRKKTKEKDEAARETLMKEYLSKKGFSYRCSTSEIVILLDDKKEIIFSLPRTVTAETMKQAVDIAERFQNLLNSFPSLNERIEFRQRHSGIGSSVGLCLLTKSNVIVVHRKEDEAKDVMPDATSFLSKFAAIEDQLKQIYGKTLLKHSFAKRYSWEVFEK